MKTRRCNYRGHDTSGERCTRTARPGHTTCARHYTAGRHGEPRPDTETPGSHPMTDTYFHPDFEPIPREAIAEARVRAREADAERDQVVRELVREGAILEVAAEWGNINPEALIEAVDPRIAARRAQRNR